MEFLSSLLFKKYISKDLSLQLALKAKEYATLFYK